MFEADFLKTVWKKCWKKVYPPFLKGFYDKNYLSDFGICSFETPSSTLEDLGQNLEAAVIQQLILACLALRSSEFKGKWALCSFDCALHFQTCPRGYKRVQKGPIWSNMVNMAKICLKNLPNGSGITRSPGMLLDTLKSRRGKCKKPVVCLH